MIRTLRNVFQHLADAPDLSDYLILISPKRLRNPFSSLRRGAGQGRPRSKFYVASSFSTIRPRSRTGLLIQTGCMQLLSRVVVFLAAGSWEARHALTSIRRIGAIGLPTPNVKLHPFYSRFCPRVALAGQEGVALQKNGFAARSFGMSAAALSGHSNGTWRVSAFRVKRTWLPYRKMSANDPKRTSAMIASMDSDPLFSVRFPLTLTGGAPMKRREFLGLVAGGIVWAAIGQAQQRTNTTDWLPRSPIPAGVQSPHLVRLSSGP